MLTLVRFPVVVSYEYCSRYGAGPARAVADAVAVQSPPEGVQATEWEGENAMAAERGRIESAGHPHSFRCDRDPAYATSTCLPYSAFQQSGCLFGEHGVACERLDNLPSVLPTVLKDWPQEVDP